MSDQFLSICCSCVCISTLLQCWNFLRNIRSALVLCVILLLDFQFLCLPKYNHEVEFLPASKEDREGKFSADREVVDMSELYTDIMRRSSKDSIPRASSLSSIDSIMTPSRMSGGDLDTTCSSTHASTEPSDYVRGLDPKAKRLSSGRGNVTAEPEVIHPQPPLSTNSKRNDSWLHDQKESISKWAYHTNKSLIE